MITTDTALTLINSADRLLETGAHETALKNLLPVWDYQNPNTDPNLNAFNKADAASLLLYCGIHYGLHRLTEKGAQEKSKNLLTLADNEFQKLQLSDLAQRDKERLIPLQTNCANYLAVSYWRMGDIENAEAYLETAFSFHDALKPLNAARLYTYIVEALILHDEGKHVEIIEKLQKRRNDFLQSGNLYLRGHFNSSLGTALKNTQQFDEALRAHKLANELFGEIKNRRFVAYSNNSIACLYQAKGDLTRAVKYAERALAIAKNVGDRRFLGVVEETLASIYLDKDELETALKYAQKSVAALRDLECYRLLLLSLKTLFKILWELEKTGKALETYAKAWNIAMSHVGENEAEKLTQFVDHFQRKEKIKRVLQDELTAAGECVRLRFAEGFKPVGKVTPIQLETNAYSNLGFNSGTIIIVEEVEAESGNFVAAVYGEECYLGFLHSYEGMVSLEIHNELLFDPSSDVQILGKVIGYCPNPPDAEGYYQVVSFE